MTSLMGVEVDCPFSPGLLRKVAYTGAQSCSFPKATKDLEALAEVAVTAKKIERWTKRVGDERIAEVEAEAIAYQELSLPDRHRRAGFRRVTCKSCGRFWGYDVETGKPERPKR